MPPFYFLTLTAKVSKKFGLKKKSRYRSRKHLVSKKSLGIGLENIWSRKKVSVSVSKILVSKKSLGIGLDEIFWSRHSVTVMNIQLHTHTIQGRQTLLKCPKMTKTRQRQLSQICLGYFHMYQELPLPICARFALV